MQIEGLRIVDNKLSPTYFMDVAINEEETIAVPIGIDAFITLSDFTAGQVSAPENRETPMGLPA